MMYSAPELGSDLARQMRAMLDEAYEGDFADEDWEHACGGMHFWIEQDGEIAAHAAVVIRTIEFGEQRLRAGYVEAVATREQDRGKGYGTAVMRAAGEWIEQNCEAGVLSTGEAPFYARLGWEMWQGPTWMRREDGSLERTEDDDGGIMVLRTGRSPAWNVQERIVAEERSGDVW